MKARLSLYIAVCLLAAMLLVPGSAGAMAQRIECTGWEEPVDSLSEGEWSFPDGNIHVRGMMSVYLEHSSCPEIAGITSTSMNANWDANFVGPIWGTGVTVNVEGGVWEGSWQGKMNLDGSYTYEAVMHGVSGSVKGMQSRLSASYVPGGVTTWTAVILNPHGE